MEWRLPSPPCASRRSRLHQHYPINGSMNTFFFLFLFFSFFFSVFDSVFATNRMLPHDFRSFLLFYLYPFSCYKLLLICCWSLFETKRKKKETEKEGTFARFLSLLSSHLLLSSSPLFRTKFLSSFSSHCTIVLNNNDSHVKSLFILKFYCREICSKDVWVGLLRRPFFFSVFTSGPGSGSWQRACEKRCRSSTCRGSCRCPNVQHRQRAGCGLFFFFLKRRLYIN